MSDIKPSKAAADEEPLQQKITAAMLDQGEQSVKAEMNNEPETFEDVLKKLVGAEIAATDAITSREGLAKLKEGAKEIGKALLGGKKSMTDLEETEYWVRLDKFLWGAGNIDAVTPDYNSAQSSFHLQGTLKMIVLTKNNFPAEYQQVAQRLLDKFELQKWGAEEESEGEGMADSKGKKRSNNSKQKSQSAKRPKGDSTQVTRSAPTSHPIYGTSGPLHDIIRYPAKNGFSYRVADGYKSKEFRVYGNNNQSVGKFWILRIAVHRDGVHGERSAGISGDTINGAFSVVASNCSMDKDQGDVLWYTESGAEDSTSKAPEAVKTGTKALLRSVETRQPIRVIRGAGKWHGAPSCGFRYDGLYTAVESTVRENTKGGKYFDFKLVRLQGQDDINTSVPDRKQEKQCEDAKLGY